VERIMQSVVEQYLAALENADHDALVNLFEEGALIDSPLEGKCKPSDFYATLLKQTNRSRTTNFDTMIGKKWSAVYFQYTWTMEDGTKVAFDCVDLLELRNDSLKILSLKIVYDTYGVRDKYEDLDTQKSQRND
jgi:hypothetical protein